MSSVVGVATVALASGSRTRRPSDLRSDSNVEHASRTRPIPVVRSSSCGNCSASGQSVRWTLRSPVSPV